MGDLETRPGLTKRSAAVGLTLVLGWLVYDATLAVDPSLANIETLYLIGFGALFTLFVVQWLNNRVSEQRRLTPPELTVIYTMLAVAIPFGILVRAALEGPMRRVILATARTDLSGKWLTPFWVTKSLDAREYFRRGGLMPGEIPWREWMTPILYWSAILIAFQLFAIFVVLLLRRLLIDQEKLPFPLAGVGRSIIEYRTPSGDDETSRKFRTVVRLAFILGLLFCLPAVLSITHDSANPITMNSGYYGTRSGIFGRFMVTLSWDPFVLCFLMFFPADVLLTTAVFYVTGDIVIRLACQWIGVPTPPVDTWMRHICGVGGLLGLAFWSLFFNRRLLRDAVRRALRGGRDPDSPEPFSFRVVFVGMVLSFAAFAVLFVAGLVDWEQGFARSDFYADLGRHVISLALCLFILVTLVVAIVRQKGECGWHYHSPWSVGMIVGFVHRHYFKHPKMMMETPASYLTIGQVIHFGAYHSAFGPHVHLIDALSIASHTRTRTRDVMTAVFLTLAVTLVVVIPLYLVAVHYYGFAHGGTMDRWHAFYNYMQPMRNIGYAYASSFFTRLAPWVGIPIGVALIGVVMYLRRERVGFPLSPVGVVIASGLSYFGDYSTPTIWFPIVIVLLVKRMIYRWFGVAWFQRRVIPTVLFVMMGLMTGMFVYKLIFAALGRGFMRPY
ncbi:MAG TPA: DUF6785 family protein [Planctomycetota bacterium]|nr:DUF6785 family protein [Planctomycetota bacterium]